MLPLLYRELVRWYRLVDPPGDHRDEADAFVAALERAASTRPETLLELGAGAGHNAFHLKRRFRCTLTDLSPDMLALSRELNPECEHALGDLRSLRLARTFDAVLVHDAICYVTTEEDLLAAARTAYVHVRPGGAAVFAPDCVRETFREHVEVLGGDDGTRSLRGLEWSWDPDPADRTYAVEYAFLLREAGTVRAVHDRHVEGLFAAATWRSILEAAGFQVGTFSRPLGEGAEDAVFVCARPPRPDRE
jgi:SAM-dependent methyltransferase